MMTEEHKITEDTQDTSNENKKQTQLLTFTLNEEEYGISILQVKEIREWDETTRLPNSEKCMRGIINLRGVVVPIFDLRKKFQMDEIDANDKNVVIIVNLHNRTIGVLVDAVSDILTIAEEEIKTAPNMDEYIDSEYVEGIISDKDRMVVVLNIENIFSRPLAEIKTK